jgi:hypothetical protein
MLGRGPEDMVNTVRTDACHTKRIVAHYIVANTSNADEKNPIQTDKSAGSQRCLQLQFEVRWANPTTNNDASYLELADLCDSGRESSKGR